MISKYILFILSLFTLSFAFGQKVYVTDYEARTDVKVFVVDNENSADLLVYKVTHASKVGGNDGKWLFVDYSTDADKSICFVNYKHMADIVICYTDYQSWAGWKDKSKKHLMY